MKSILLGAVLILAACEHSSSNGTISASEVAAMPRVNFNLAQCSDVGPASGTSGTEIYMCQAGKGSCFVYDVGGTQHSSDCF